MAGTQARMDSTGGGEAWKEGSKAGGRLAARIDGSRPMETRSTGERGGERRGWEAARIAVVWCGGATGEEERFLRRMVLPTSLVIFLSLSLFFSLSLSLSLFLSLSLSS